MIFVIKLMTFCHINFLSTRIGLFQAPYHLIALIIYLTKIRNYICDKASEASGMKLTSLPVLLLMLLSGSTVLTVAIHIQTQKYLNMINRLDDCYKNILDDLCGMMDIALRFRDDPNYNYNPSDMKSIVMRDGINGTEELIELFHEIINATQNGIIPSVEGNTTKV